MVAKSQQSAAILIERLVKRSHNYSFYQAIRWLNHISNLQLQESGIALDIKVTPHLSLDFAGNDIQKIIYTPETNSVEIIATFLGLYGTVSPLPTFYTENLIRDVNDGKKSGKEFLDIFHKTLYQKIYKMWSKYKLNMMATEAGNTKYLNRIYYLIGLGDKTLRDMVPDVKSLVRYTGLFSNSNRSLVSLETMLEDYFRVTLKVSSTKRVINEIPSNQQVSVGLLNSHLGNDLYLGSQATGFGTYLKVDIYNLDIYQLKMFSDGGDYAKMLSFIVKFYSTVPVKCLLRLHLKDDYVVNVSLGDVNWAQLGQSTWFASGNKKEVYKTKYFLV